MALYCVPCLVDCKPNHPFVPSQLYMYTNNIMQNNDAIDFDKTKASMFVSCVEVSLRCFALCERYLLYRGNE